MENEIAALESMMEVEHKEEKKKKKKKGDFGLTIAIIPDNFMDDLTKGK